MSIDKKTLDDVMYNRKRVANQAKKYGESRKCPRCGGKKWRVVEAFEYGDPYLPSKIILWCLECKRYSETFAEAPIDQAMAYAKAIKEEQSSGALEGFKVASPEEADRLIASGEEYGKKKKQKK